MASVLDQLAFTIAEKFSSRKKDQPPKEWFYKTFDKVKKENPSYSDDQARATVGHIWYEVAKPGTKTKLKKEENK